MFDPSEQLKRMQRMAMETGNREYHYPNSPHTAFAYHSYDTTTLMPEIDMVIYDGNTRTYRTSKQDRKIRELENELKSKKANEESEKDKEEQSLKNLIAYYYNR